MTIKINNTTGTIQIRASSRIGHSDLGVNKRRVENLLNKIC